MSCPYYEVESFTESQYLELVESNPELIAFGIGDLYIPLLFAVPMYVGRVTNVIELIDGTLELYGDTECVFDYETMGVMPGVVDKIKENLKKHAKEPKVAFGRIMLDLNNALANISRRVLEKLEYIESPIFDEIGAAYRYHGLENGQVLLKLLPYSEIKELAGRKGGVE